MLIGRRPLRHVAMLGRVAYDAGVAKARRARARVQAPPAVAGPDVVAALRERTSSPRSAS